MKALLVLVYFAASCLAQVGPSSVPKEQSLGDDVAVRELAPGVWLHRSVATIGQFGRVESNGLLLVGQQETVLIDTPVSVQQTTRLLEWADSIRHPVRHALFTHAHNDRIGGIDALLVRGIQTYALPRTIEMAKRNGFALPKAILAEDAPLQLAGIKMHVFYPGTGHTPDNIVIWLPEKDVLFGGCFLKAADASTMGNIAEADLVSWERGSKELLRRYAKAKVVIPGHGAVGGREVLEHTLKLVQANLNPPATQ